MITNNNTRDCVGYKKPNLSMKPSRGTFKFSCSGFPTEKPHAMWQPSLFQKVGGQWEGGRESGVGVDLYEAPLNTFFFNSGLSRLRFFRAAPPRKLHIPCRGCSSAWFHLRHQGQLLRRASSNARCRQGELLLSDVLSESNLRWNAFIIVIFLFRGGASVTRLLTEALGQIRSALLSQPRLLH